MILVRPAVLEDLDVIADFQVRMARETEDFDLRKETLEDGVRAVFDDPTKGEYYVAEIEGEPVGVLLTVTEWSDWRNGEVIWIHSLYVIPEARRQGVFREMYLYLKHKVGASSELRGLRLYVHNDNEAAQRVYESLGMDGDRYRLFEWMPEH